ncbi:MAG: hypothetical protein AMJ93_09655, partial [Anaerolineae bacterium SM23_84]
AVVSVSLADPVGNAVCGKRVKVPVQHPFARRAGQVSQTATLIATQATVACFSLCHSALIDAQVACFSRLVPRWGFGQAKLTSRLAVGVGCLGQGFVRLLSDAVHAQVQRRGN